jgi:D-threo-aldose 1-dehydrogenase
LIIQGAIFRAQLERNVATFRHAIPADFWAEVKHDKLIRSDALTPA